jgi:tetratricopeptide (TPR) repeat protein
MALHAFVAMPYGEKGGIDFNRVYSEYIKPALDSAGLEVFRADEDTRAGSILKDMFQELLLADLVVADLSIDNPNVWYELGVRHALRARGVILVQCKRDYQPFDVYSDRKLGYHIKGGVPDPDFLEKDKSALTTMVKDTMAAPHGRRTSPVYYHLHELKEPGWETLQLEELKEVYEKWECSPMIARHKNRPGDILVYAEEAPFYAVQFEAYRCAGQELARLGQFSFALEQYEKALKIDPDDLKSCQQKGIMLGRLGKHAQAEVWLETLNREHPNDPETLALLGRVQKDAWVANWRKGRNAEEMRKIAALEDGLLREAIRYYTEGFKIVPGHYYSGINAVTLIHLLHHLTGDESQSDLCRYMEGGVRWDVQSAILKEQAGKKDEWARLTLGDLEVLVGDTKTVERAYKDAVAIVENDWFALNSSRQQLTILHDLGYRLEHVEAALSIFDRALEKLKPPFEPQHLFLFSGHMIDAPGRVPPRFPKDKEKIAAREIAKKLDELDAGPKDLALCGGACGGDLLFAEACLARGLRLEVRIPFEEPTFLEKSVAFADDQWRDRFYGVKKNSNTSLLVMPEELGPLSPKSNPYERNNLWQLYTALSWGPGKVHFICLWDGKGGDGPGGTKHMHDSVKKRSGLVYVLDTNILFKEDKL